MGLPKVATFPPCQASDRDCRAIDSSGVLRGGEAIPTIVKFALSSHTTGQSMPKSGEIP